MIFYFAIEYCRKVSLCFIVTYFQKEGWLQLIGFFITTITLIIVSGLVKTRETGLQIKLDVLNESNLVVTVYHMMLFTMFVPEATTKHDIGTSCVLVIFLTLLINFYFIQVAVIRQSVRRCRLCYFKRKLKAQLPSYISSKIGERREKGRSQMVDR